MRKKRKKQDWQIRIVEYGVKPAKEFKAHDLNPREHPTDQREPLRGSLSTIGFIKPVIENVRSGKLIDGHGRIEEALAISDEMPIPFVTVDLDQSEEALAIATLDEITKRAKTNADVFKLLQARIQTSNEVLNNFLGDVASRVGVVIESVKKQTVDVSAFKSSLPPQIYYRVIVEELSLADAEELQRKLEKARVEQYRKN